MKLARLILSPPAPARTKEADGSPTSQNLTLESTPAVRITPGPPWAHGTDCIAVTLCSDYGKGMGY